MGILDSTKAMNIAEAVKRAGFDSQAAVLGELQAKNDFLDEVPWLPASHGSYHKFLKAKRLGKGDFSKINTGIPSITSGADEMTEPVTLYEGESIVDSRILEGVVDKASVRDSEDVLSLEGMVQDWLQALIYQTGKIGSLKALAERRNAVDNKYVFSCGGAGSDLSSMWIFEFGEAGFHLRHNTLGTPGFSNTDMGKVRVKAPDGTGDMWAWVRLYKIYAAIVLRNERALLRIANIKKDGETNNLIDKYNVILKAKNELQNVGRDAIGFVNRTLKAQIDIMAFNKQNGAFSVRDITGFGPIVSIAGLPIRMMEGITDTESTVA
ncbi:MAG: hypothetical protein FWF38_00495 [Spirochaetaceae bacterium]|nr:hypothetical protein [Spirochaetaceae bacterium]